MKKFEITYRDEESCGKKITLRADSAETLGQAILDYVDMLYGVDADTDGHDVWYFDANGEPYMIMRDMQFEEVDAE